MNKDYGQSLVEVRENLWLLGSKKHPEYEFLRNKLNHMQRIIEKIEKFVILHIII